MLAFSVLVLLAISRPAFAQVAEASALMKDDKWEVSVIFDPDVAGNSALGLENYTFPGSNITAERIRYVALDNAVVITVTGLRTNDLYSVQIENLRRTNNSVIPPATASFTAQPMSWAEIGAHELEFRADAVAVGTNGFDLVSGGSQMRDDYDETTFAFEQVTGNFDKKVRIQFQEPSSMEARAGLMVRESIDEGRTRPVDPTDRATAFSRYLQVHVNPAKTAYTEDGVVMPGNNSYQINFRGQTGITLNPEITNNVAPPSSNAWVRLRRVGDLFEAFRGVDGTNWVRIGSFTFPTEDFNGDPLPKFTNTVYIGPSYSAEVANIPESSGERRSFLAQFRDYGDTGLVATEPPTLAINRIGAQVDLTWEGGGTLESSTNLTSGIWRAVSGSSPVRAAATNRFEFFRVRIP